MNRVVLIVDDDPIQRRLVEAQIERMGLRPFSCNGGRAAIRALDDHRPGEICAVVLDLMMPDQGGEEVLAEMRRRRLDIPVIVQTAKGSIDTVVEAMRAGAFDFVVKPVSPDKLRAVIDSALKMRGATARRTARKDGVARLDQSNASPALGPVLAAAAKAARSGIPVLLSGETGVGKEWLADAIQAGGERAGAPFVKVNCGALPADLVESILFGHAKGAFTDAGQPHEGKFVEAHGGTLLLDEIGELSASAQVKLLRVLQDGVIDPVGGRLAVKTDVRIISATNRDLAAAVSAGRFREDLYYRLNAFELTVPPLRERRSEIAKLARRFVDRYVEMELQSPVRHLAADAIALLRAYDWPGNIRQLENAIHRAVVLGESESLTAEDFPQIAALIAAGPDRLASSSEPHSDPAGNGTLNGAAPSVEVHANSLGNGRMEPADFALRDQDGEVRRVEEVEADLIRLAHAHYQGRMSEIARRLGIGRSTLYRKMREYKIDAD
ncbi:sigma-54 dependent transcriptional regulator [Aurantimonas sp. A2-1-M11]|uniref:sigma-54-dependent transcriptional regulator n=1 Tax=Aurantimonas sp. A2-1-M11 TaxID=3113712 RepID=UPI002F924E87